MPRNINGRNRSLGSRQNNFSFDIQSLLQLLGGLGQPQQPGLGFTLAPGLPRAQQGQGASGGNTNNIIQLLMGVLGTGGLSGDPRTNRVQNSILNQSANIANRPAPQAFQQRRGGVLQQSLARRQAAQQQQLQQQSVQDQTQSANLQNRFQQAVAGIDNPKSLLVQQIANRKRLFDGQRPTPQRAGLPI